MVTIVGLAEVGWAATEHRPRLPLRLQHPDCGTAATEHRGADRRPRRGSRRGGPARAGDHHSDGRLELDRACPERDEERPVRAVARRRRRIAAQSARDPRPRLGFATRASVSTDRADAANCPTSPTSRATSALIAEPAGSHHPPDDAFDYLDSVRWSLAELRAARRPHPQAGECAASARRGSIGAARPHARRAHTSHPGRRLAGQVLYTNTVVVGLAGRPPGRGGQPVLSRLQRAVRPIRHGRLDPTAIGEDPLYLLICHLHDVLEPARTPTSSTFPHSTHLQAQLTLPLRAVQQEIAAAMAYGAAAIGVTRAVAEDAGDLMLERCDPQVCVDVLSCSHAVHQDGGSGRSRTGRVERRGRRRKRRSPAASPPRAPRRRSTPTARTRSAPTSPRVTTAPPGPVSDDVFLETRRAPSNDTIDNAITKKPQVVTIDPTDATFKTTRLPGLVADRPGPARLCRQHAGSGRDDHARRPRWEPADLAAAQRRHHPLRQRQGRLRQDRPRSGSDRTAARPRRPNPAG